jgi:hypothetical protein
MAFSQKQLLIFFAFTTIWSSLFLCIEASKRDKAYQYNPTTVVFLVDLVKLVVTLIGIKQQGVG